MTGIPGLEELHLLLTYRCDMECDHCFVWSSPRTWATMSMKEVRSVIDQAADYLFWIALIPLVTFAAFLWDGIFIGATESGGMRNSMLISTLLVFIPVFFITRPLLHNHGLWLALILFMISRGVTQTLIARRGLGGRVRER